MIRVALADDHHQVREIWYFILSANDGFDVVAKCRNGQEVVDAMPVYMPDVILMDINMQPVNGIEATEMIARDYPSVKIIGMSMHAEPVYIKRMLQAGAHGYVTKDSPYEEVLTAIQRVHAGNFYLCKEVERKMPELTLSAR
jgi:two-component system, NarL family, invasion response regulator UvrY